MGAGDVEDRRRGSVAPLLALVVVAGGSLVLGVGRVGADAADAARARTAADAAALAAAAEGGEGTARALATGNGGELVAFRRDGPAVEVRVRVGEVERVARAVRTGAPGPSGAGREAGLVPELRAALARAEAALGRAVPVTSGWRSGAEQRALYRGRAGNPFPVARPGTSSHERGRAVDVAGGIVADLARLGPAVGLCRPLPETDPVHFELCPTRAGS
ncbi:MAG: hypothetical protein ACRDZ9_09755 [Acidimicrobiales bacterium]